MRPFSVNFDSDSLSVSFSPGLSGCHKIQLALATPTFMIHMPLLLLYLSTPLSMARGSGSNGPVAGWLLVMGFPSAPALGAPSGDSRY
jgi:hypothetical protein